MNGFWFRNEHRCRITLANLVLGDRSMAGRLTLDQLIGVRIPVPQSWTVKCASLGEVLLHGQSNFSCNHFMDTHELTIPRPKYCVYVLYSLSDHHFYIGYSANLEQRLAEHDSGKSASTASRRPFRLIFCEYYLSKRDALGRERYFKTTAGKRTLKLMLQTSIQEISTDGMGAAVQCWHLCSRLRLNSRIHIILALDNIRKTTYHQQASP